MAEQAKGDIEIDATPEQIMDVLVDFESYPTWAQGIKKSEIKKKDSKGRATEVYQEAGAMGFNAQYLLAYSYTAKNGGLTWSSKEASGVVKSIEGEYKLEPKGDKTKVTYLATLELSMPVPGMIKRQAEKQMISQALGGLKKQVEKG